MLYLIKSNCVLKIGTSNNLKTRLATYKTHNPDIELLDACDGNLKEESEIHLLLKDYQYKERKEWFIECKEVYNIWDKFKIELEKRKNKELENIEHIDRFISLVEEDQFLEIYDRENGKIFRGLKEWALSINATYKDFCNLYLKKGRYDFLFPEESAFYINRKCYKDESILYIHYDIFNNICISADQNTFLDEYDTIKNQIDRLKTLLNKF